MIQAELVVPPSLQWGVPLLNQKPPSCAPLPGRKCSRSLQSLGARPFKGWEARALQGSAGLGRLVDGGRVSSAFWATPLCRVTPQGMIYHEIVHGNSSGASCSAHLLAKHSLCEQKPKDFGCCVTLHAAKTLNASTEAPAQDLSLNRHPLEYTTYCTNSQCHWKERCTLSGFWGRAWKGQTYKEKKQWLAFMYRWPTHVVSKHSCTGKSNSCFHENHPA